MKKLIGIVTVFIILGMMKAKAITLIALIITIAVGSLVVGGVLFASKSVLNAGQTIIDNNNHRLSNELTRAVQRVGDDKWLVHFPESNGVYNLSEEQLFWLATNVHKYKIEGRVNPTNQWRWLGEYVGTKQAITSLALEVARMEGQMSPNTRFATWRIVQISP